MDHQTKLNGRRLNGSASAGLRRNMSDLFGDVITLAELQWQLFTVDVQEGRSRCSVALGLLLACLTFMAAAVPIGLAGFGWVLVERAGWPRDVAFLTVALATFIIFGTIGYIGFRRLKSAAQVLLRSRQELGENIQWIKQALHHRGSRQSLERTLD